MPEIGSCDSLQIECVVLGDTNCSEHIEITAIAHFQSIWCEVPAANDELTVEFRSSTRASPSSSNPSVSHSTNSPELSDVFERIGGI
eukprot:TRINITY_DN89_c0_g1_i1.p2 TRINITY_DN89_c0_g1~~TRINITY_DN89_c0_g1_i1.p2  ORF type:complete len:87 (+),score=17.07 TRINITY_DN89_c0_g1_i1:1133-1393(+)